ncbi:MAG: response regulator [Candidatus Zixiibacteriota bacterium]|nr:MAG: response regulator [candidate division Zixibacteria bacterium]
MSFRILVIDDDQALRLLYKSELESEGYRVDCVGSGKEALKIFSDGSYAVALVDIEMPDISGLELLGKLRKESPQTALILNSAYAVYKADFKSWMADGYVVKSSDLQVLKDKIRKVVTEHETVRK